MKTESVGWIIVAATFLGVVVGLSTMKSVQRDCVPLEQPGYGRSPINLRLRAPDGLL